MSEERCICESACFKILLPNRPHIDRNDGGHLVIYPKMRRVSCISELSSNELLELGYVVSAVERAYIRTMKEQGIPIIWMNFQDNGNWAFLRGEQKSFHIQVYGRCSIEKSQTPGQALVFPDPSNKMYDTNQPLTEEDIELFVKYFKDAIAN